MGDITKYDEKFAAMAAEYAANTQGGGKFISTRGGILSINGEPVAGNSLYCVVLDFIHTNIYYNTDYDPDSISSPVCYAYSRTGKDFAPHAECMTPQSEKCKGCRYDEFGSANKGTGKACGNTRRLALIPAATVKKNDVEIFTTADDYSESEMVYLKTTVTSSRSFDTYVKSLAASKRPPFAVITEIKPEPDAKTQFKLTYRLVQTISDPDILDVLFTRNQHAREEIEFPFPKFEEDELILAKPKGKKPAAKKAAPAKKRKY